jgi:NAD(P)-dependent dehydrogenase (short-subunit alcohol dehydrogenase family)
MRDLARGEELRETALAETLPISTIELNVDDDNSVTRALGQVLSEQGPIDFLVNNAGIGGGGAIEEVPMATFRRIMETNFFGGLRCIQAVLPSMRMRRQGCIVNVTSVAGQFAMSPQGPYAASKWAFKAVSECLAQEMKAFNIRVAIVEPGVIATPLTMNRPPPPPESLYPFRRRIGALFVASLKKPVSPYVVGEQIKQIVEGDSAQLRYPVGPDVEPLLSWRAGMSDERWIELGAGSDAEWAAEIKRSLGLDLEL